jgi:hypothetical protein
MNCFGALSPDSFRDRSTGMVQQRQRLGGMLNYYYRASA